MSKENKENEDIGKLTKEANVLITELRETIESKKADSVEGKEKIEKLNARLDEIDVANEKVTANFQAAKERELEQTKNIEMLEKQIYRFGSGEKAERKAEMKAFEKFITHGVTNGIMEEKYLRSDGNTDGGYLSPPEFIREILKKITEISPIRQIARVRPAGAGMMYLPVRSTLITSGWEGESEEGGSSNSTYARENIPLNMLNVTTPITLIELQDAAFDMESEISQDVSEEFNLREGKAFVNGTAHKQPEGFMVNANVASRNTESTTDVPMDSIINLAGDLKTGYNPVYGMNRKTLARLRTQKGGDGQYLWVVGNIAGGVPNTLNGEPYIIIPDMDDISSAKYPVVYGDFKRGYLIGDRMAMNVVRDEFTRKKEGRIEFTFLKRTGGAVVLPEALKKLKCSIT